MVRRVVRAGAWADAEQRSRPPEVGFEFQSLRRVRNAIVAKDPDAAGGRCLAADVTAMEGTIFSVAPELAPGSYRALIQVKLPVINNINTAPLAWTFTVSSGDKILGQAGFSMLNIERAGAYQEFACPSTSSAAAPCAASSPGNAPAHPDSKGGMRVEQKDIPVQPDWTCWTRSRKR